MGYHVLLFRASVCKHVQESGVWLPVIVCLVAFFVCCAGHTDVTPRFYPGLVLVFTV